MSQADVLLNSLSEDDISTYTANPETEPHIVVGKDRKITVPEELKRIAVQHDHNIETVTFDCPRYWDGHDFTTMKLYVNYMRSDGYIGRYPVTNVRVDSEDNAVIHFEWTISRNLTIIVGSIKFLVCAKRTTLEGKEITHWNTDLNTDMYVTEGLEAENIEVESDPDAITELLTRMDEVEELAKTSDALYAADLYAKSLSLMYAEVGKVNERIDEAISGNGIAISETRFEIPEAFNDSISGYLITNGMIADLVITKLDVYDSSGDDHEIAVFGDSSVKPVRDFTYHLSSNSSGNFSKLILRFDEILGGVSVLYNGDQDFSFASEVNPIVIPYPLATVGILEVNDVRLDYFGYRHDTAGEAVRSQVERLLALITNLEAEDANNKARIKYLEQNGGGGSGIGYIDAEKHIFITADLTEGETYTISYVNEDNSTTDICTFTVDETTSSEPDEPSDPEEPSYTNLAEPRSDDAEINYELWSYNARMGGDGVVEEATGDNVGMTVTNYFDVSAGDVVRFKNFQTQRIGFYDADGTPVDDGVARPSGLATDQMIQNVTSDIDITSNANAEPTEMTFTINPTANATQSIAYARLSGRVATGKTAEDVIITVNQEIV